MKLFKMIPCEDKRFAYQSDATLSDLKAALAEYGLVAVPVDVAEYYAKESNYTDGDVPGHIYALDDGGGMMHAALKAAQEQK